MSMIEDRCARLEAELAEKKREYAELMCRWSWREQLAVDAEFHKKCATIEKERADAAALKLAKEVVAHSETAAELDGLRRLVDAHKISWERRVPMGADSKRADDVQAALRREIVAHAAKAQELEKMTKRAEDAEAKLSFELQEHSVSLSMLREKQAELKKLRLELTGLEKRAVDAEDAISRESKLHADKEAQLAIVTAHARTLASRVAALFQADPKDSPIASDHDAAEAYRREVRQHAVTLAKLDEAEKDLKSERFAHSATWKHVGDLRARIALTPIHFRAHDYANPKKSPRVGEDAQEQKKQTERPSCKSCAFSAFHHNITTNATRQICMRYPPASDGHPDVAPAGWCGEHKPKQP